MNGVGQNEAQIAKGKWNKYLFKYLLGNYKLFSVKEGSNGKRQIA
jgi:hypothetical protein